MRIQLECPECGQVQDVDRWWEEFDCECGFTASRSVDFESIVDGWKDAGR